MASINKVILIGNLGKDPEMKYTPSGKAICKFSLATNATWKDANGEKKEAVTWHNIETWSRIAEICNEYLHKGSKVYIEGRIDNRKYTGDDGVDKYFSSVVAATVQFLDSKGDSVVPGREQGGDDSQSQQMPADDEIPF
jgi:single-strand DNA-binding protein